MTFLFTDIEGSTRLWEQHPDGMRTALERHDEIVRSVIESHGGYVFSTAGDSFAAAFARAGDAAAATVEAQMVLAGEVWPDGVSICVRMGLHSGVCQEREGDYFGPVVNRAARLMSAGHGGQVVVSSTTHELLAGQVDSDALVALGEVRLKDLAAPQQVWQLGDSDFGPLRSLDQRRHNLPVQRTELFGRAGDVAAVEDLVARQRAVTLTGGGGAGKTRLSLAVAAELVDGFADGVFFVDLSSLLDGSSIPDMAAKAAGLPLDGYGGSGQTVAEFAAELLGRRDLLLVLDNCEHLVDDAADFVDAVLGAGEMAKVLATSREALDIDGEHTYRVPRLQVDPTQPSGGPAVELFVVRALAAGGEVDASDPAIRRICDGLDGVPLAIELAAVQSTVMSPTELEQHLGERFELLVGGRRGRRGRQTLQAVLDWSWDLLTATEQDLLVQLSVFSGGWTLAASTEVCEVDGSVPVLMRSLVSKSLIEPIAGSDTTRFGMLESVRLFAQTRLAERQGTATYRDRHLDWLLSWVLARPVDDYLCSGSWCSEYVGDLDNVRAGIRWALEHGRVDDAADLTTAGLVAWWSGMGVVGEFEDLVERCVALGATASAKLLLTRAFVALVAGLHAQIEPRLNDTIDAAGAQGDLQSLAAAQSLRGFVTAVIAPDDALALCDEAHSHAERSGARQIQALALCWGSPSYLARDDPTEAIGRCENALALDLELRSVAQEHIFACLGFSYAAAGRYSEAQEAFGSAHRAGVLAPTSWEVSQAGQAFVAALKGDIGVVRALLAEALHVSSSNVSGVADIAIAISCLLVQNDEREAAAELVAAIHRQPLSYAPIYEQYRRLRSTLEVPEPPKQRLAPQELHDLAERLLDSSGL
ncbi:MAG: adenylate/guanylate cyclase domain-containing protein [Actinomycetia bacterium]|nr:adenylate/guanylate cyclase domain-containing protein [Actinomycetes bacterium]